MSYPSANFKHKIGTILQSQLIFTADEWADIDFSENPVSAKMTQGSNSVDAEITYIEQDYTILIKINLESFNPGIGVFDVWIGETSIPTNYNLRVELIRGITE